MSSTTKRLEYSTLEQSSKWRSLPPPPGFSKSVSTRNNVKTPVFSPAVHGQMKEQRALDFATGPAKQLPMQAFMLYMSGSGVQIFSMGIVFMLLMSPFKNIASMNAAFAQFAPSTATNPNSFSVLSLQKLVYVLCNLVVLGVGLWKCRSMGLLPTGTGDWLAFETRGLAPETVLFS